MWNLFKHELFSRKIAIVGWGIGLALFSAIYIGVYPAMADQMAAFAEVEIYKSLGFDMGSFAGYIASVVVGIMPVILGVFVIMLSTGTLAGEEDNGTLELIVAMPLPRWQVVAMKSAALAVVLLLVVGIMAAGASLILAMVAGVTEVDVTPMQLFGALVATFPMMLAFFSIGLFLGTVMPNRRSAVAVMAFLFIGSFLIKSVSGFVTSLDAIKGLSLFSYVNTTASTFSEGFNFGNTLILLGVAAVFFALSVWGFQGRNVTVGQWIWQRKNAA
jgi:ABC-2 type transport system permease protein